MREFVLSMDGLLKGLTPLEGDSLAEPVAIACHNLLLLPNGVYRGAFAALDLNASHTWSGWAATADNWVDDDGDAWIDDDDVWLDH